MFYVCYNNKKGGRDMKKFISSILILGFAVMPMSYMAFAQGETETKTEVIQGRMSDKEQKECLILKRN